MKKRHILLITLGLVISIQTVVLIYQYLKIDLYKKYDQIQILEKQPSIYIMDLTYSVDKAAYHMHKARYLNTWLIRHFDNTLITLEQEKGLEPLPYKEFLGIPGHFSEESPKIKEPFYEPYSEPNLIAADFNKEEQPIQYIMARLNFSTLNLLFIEASINERVKNFEKRLERLQTLEQINE